MKTASGSTGRRSPEEKLRIPPEKLRWRCRPEWIPGDSSDQIAPTEEIIGQERALRAIETGLRLKSPGYNVFVAGLTGTGKMTTIRRLLEQINVDGEVPGDICYVYNFHDPDQPIPLYLAPGEGTRLARDMDKMVQEFARLIPGIEENEQFGAEKKSLIDRYRKRNQEIFKQFEERVQAEGLALMQVQIGGVQQPEIFPVINNEVVPWESLTELVDSGKLTREQVNALHEKHDSLMEELSSLFQQTKELQQELAEKLESLRLKYLRPAITHWKRHLKATYKGREIHEHFDRLFSYLESHLDDFDHKGDEQKTGLLAALSTAKRSSDPLLVYRVNVLVDNSGLEKPPIVIETAPNFPNLFGTIEHTLQAGGIWHTDFMHIKAGSLLAANGGYLVFNFLDAISDPRVWPALKRVLKNNEIIIQPEMPPYFPTTSSIRPKPIRVNVKVVVVGDYYSYQYLYENEDEFRKIFKIRADFDTEMKNTRRTIRQYARFISKICRTENLLPLDREGMAAVAEFGVELAGRNNKLSTRFSDVADVIREAHYWAERDSASRIGADHIRRAIQERRYRLSMTEDKVQELILNNVLLIQTKGERVGQVNGLSVYDMGDYSFGKPSKITAEVAMGRSGIINIEREAELSGKIYNKGVLIISGYLNGKYAQDIPLTVNASICFEQSYSGVDGDSASAAEIFALLSSLANVPLRQDLAVTGSVSQKGEIQPVGGINEKIEGFYRVCKARKLTGTQGVVIPKKNLPDLMLEPEVVESVRRGEFHIYAIDTVDEGLELLTGLPAGKRNRQGAYPAGSVHFRVQQRLIEFAQKMKEFEA